VVRERENDRNVLMGGEGRRQSIRIESATEGNVGSGDGSTQVEVGRLKSFGYESGRMEPINT
jgi:hypothetical protein